MKRKIFGNRIEVNCNYCNNSVLDNNSQYCIKYCGINRKIKDGRCRKFDYNPLLRIPKSEPILMQFSKKDFEL